LNNTQVADWKTAPLCCVKQTLNIQKNCNPYNVCQLAESEARAFLVANGKSDVKKLKGYSKINFFLKLRFKEPTDGELRIFRDIAFQICGTA